METIYLPSVDPVENIEEAVQTERCHVVRRDVFNDSNLVKHPNLWNESERLEPKTEAPAEFPWSPSRVDDRSQNNSSRRKRKPVREVVSLLVIRLN